MSLRIASASSRTASISMPVSLWSCISRMALVCSSERRYLAIREPLASSLVLALRMILMTSSRWSRAIIRPASMWARFSASLSLNSVLRLTTSNLCSM